jgi:hypothetical protein
MFTFLEMGPLRNTAPYFVVLTTTCRRMCGKKPERSFNPAREASFAWIFFFLTNSARARTSNWEKVITFFLFLN